MLKSNLKFWCTVLVVTGSSCGIGKAYAEELAKRGLNLILISRDSRKLQQTAIQISKEYIYVSHFVVNQCYIKQEDLGPMTVCNCNKFFSNLILIGCQLLLHFIPSYTFSIDKLSKNHISLLICHDSILKAF